MSSTIVNLHFHCNKNKMCEQNTLPLHNYVNGICMGSNDGHELGSEYRDVYSQ